MLAKLSTFLVFTVISLGTYSMDDLSPEQEAIIEGANFFQSSMRFNVFDCKPIVFGRFFESYTRDIREASPENLYNIANQMVLHGACTVKIWIEGSLMHYKVHNYNVSKDDGILKEATYSITQ